jgi:hypothetical protein
MLGLCIAGGAVQQKHRLRRILEVSQHLRRSPKLTSVRDGSMRGREVAHAA